MPTVVLLLALQCTVMVWLAAPPLSLAQSPITPSGLNTQVSAPIAIAGKTQFDITGGTRAGTNLFHSFGQFNVPSHNIANFRNETGLPTSNILGRVTDGNISTIFGTVQTTNFGPANLFLMNPAGFLFGPNATVNVGGMVAFTTADYLRLADGVRFNAIPNPTANALLSASPVAAFGFLGTDPGAITVQGSQLTVSQGTGISLVGGNITIQSGTLGDGTVQPARLSAPAGQINVVSVASSGEVPTNNGAGPITAPPATSVGSFGSVALSQGTTIDTSAESGGRIVIRAGQLTMEDSSIRAVATNGQSGAISITAETLALTNGAIITADSHGTAAAGDIIVNVNTLTTQAGVKRIQLNPDDTFTANGNLIASDSRSTLPGAGPAGSITIQGVGGPGTAATNILLRDTTISSRVFGGTAATPRSAIMITADSVVLTNAGVPGGGNAATLVATTIGPAPGGNIVLKVNTLRSNVNADETPIAGSQKVFLNTSNDVGSTAGPTGTFTISGIQPNSAAKLVALNNTFISTGSDGGNPKTVPGNIIITADTLSLSNDAGIITSASSDGGAPAGNITLNVHTLRANTMPDGTLITGTPQAFITSSSQSGPAGNITITGMKPTEAAKQLALNNIELSTVSLGGAGQTAHTAPARLSMAADAIHLTQSPNIKTNTQGAAPAGDIVFSANTLLADAGSQVSSSSSGSGPGGNILMNAGQSITLSNGSSIIASSTGPGNAGNVTIQGRTGPTQSVLIDGAGSGVFTETHGAGAGGNINVLANSVSLQNGSTVSAATSGTTPSATGGSVSVNATEGITMTNGALMTASSTGPGNAGHIFINAGPQLVMQNSSIKTEASQGGGGNIEIKAGNLVQLANSNVSTSVLGGSGSGGNITIDPNVVLLQNSQILAQAVQGAGGNISITTNVLLPDANSTISASSQFGQQGTVTIQSPIAPASLKILRLTDRPLLATTILNQRCAALAGGEFSSFTMAGRESLPAEPGGWLSSPMAALDAGTRLQQVRGEGLAPSPSPLPRWGRGDGEGGLSLRQIAPPGFLTHAFAVDGSVGCAS